MLIFRFNICILCLYCDMFTRFNVQKPLYCSHTACAAASLFTLCLKPEPSLLWLVSWPALLWLVNRLEMSRPLAYLVQCGDSVTYWSHYVAEVNKGVQWKHFRKGGRKKLPLEGTLGFLPLETIHMHKKLFNTLNERENPKKHNSAPSMIMFKWTYMNRIPSLLYR